MPVSSFLPTVTLQVSAGPSLTAARILQFPAPTGEITPLAAVATLSSVLLHVTAELMSFTPSLTVSISVLPVSARSKLSAVRLSE